MLRFLPFSCLVVCALGCHPHPIQHISPEKKVGGERAYIEDYPYQLALFRNQEFRCGASIISSTIVITATHCTDETTADELSVMSGTHELYCGGTMHDVTRIHQHPDYTGRTPHKDISLLEVNPPFRFSRNVKPIALPDARSDVAVGTSADNTAWGFHLSGSSQPVNLRHVVVQVVDRSECGKAFKFNVSSRFICARAPEKDTCQGDSGGPLVQNGKLYGIYSYGKGCDRHLRPRVYTRVSLYRDWILQTVGQTEDLDGNE